jgi:hypothetical protein
MFKWPIMGDTTVLHVCLSVHYHFEDRILKSIHLSKEGGRKKGGGGVVVQVYEGEIRRWRNDAKLFTDIAY